MTLFVDSSAVVKLYVPERQHEDIRRRTGLMVIAAVTRVEVAAALWRKHRIGEIDAADAETLCAAFEADLSEPGGRFAVMATSHQVLSHATAAVARHGLRAYDAVQLATALLTRDALGGLDGFAAFDRHLRVAATAESFVLVPAVVANPLG